MGEIRSTLDIIMEKAMGVKVTEEDKAGFLRHEVEGWIRGLLQKVIDGITDVEDLASDIAAMDADRRSIAVESLRKQCLDRLTLEGDNALLLGILRDGAGFDARPVEGILRRYKEELQAGRTRQEAALRDRLKIRGISGSAVIANLKADPEWIRRLDETQDRFHRELAGLQAEA